MTNYPPADTKSQWFQDRFPGADIKPNVGVIHTAETTGWPDYEGGGTAPNYTARPSFGPNGTYTGLEWRAHFPDEKSARALKNLAGGVETNTANALQVELVGTCDPATHHRWGGVEHVFWPDAAQAVLEDLAEFVAWVYQTHAIPLHGPGAGWLPYPASYGQSPVRMSSNLWRTYTGWCGHQHVPENVHGDPGNLEWAKVVREATDLLSDDDKVEPLVIDLSEVQDAFRAALAGKPQPAGTRRHVRRLQQAMNANGASLATDGKVNTRDLSAWAHHESNAGGTGRLTVPDWQSLKALASPRFIVRK